jgi:hypothetical protein
MRAFGLWKPPISRNSLLISLLSGNFCPRPRRSLSQNRWPDGLSVARPAMWSRGAAARRCSARTAPPRRPSQLPHLAKRRRDFSPNRRQLLPARQVAARVHMAGHLVPVVPDMRDGGPKPANRFGVAGRWRGRFGVGQERDPAKVRQAVAAPRGPRPASGAHSKWGSELDAI